MARSLTFDDVKQYLVEADAASEAEAILLKSLKTQYQHSKPAAKKATPAPTSTSVHYSADVIKISELLDALDDPVPEKKKTLDKTLESLLGSEPSNFTTVPTPPLDPSEIDRIAAEEIFRLEEMKRVVQRKADDEKLRRERQMKLEQIAFERDHPDVGKPSEDSSIKLQRQLLAMAEERALKSALQRAEIAQKERELQLLQSKATHYRTLPSLRSVLPQVEQKGDEETKRRIEARVMNVLGVNKSQEESLKANTMDDFSVGDALDKALGNKQPQPPPPSSSSSTKNANSSTHRRLSHSLSSSDDTSKALSSPSPAPSLAPSLAPLPSTAMAPNPPSPAASPSSSSISAVDASNQRQSTILPGAAAVPQPLTQLQPPTVSLPYLQPQLQPQLLQQPHQPYPYQLSSYPPPQTHAYPMSFYTPPLMIPQHQTPSYPQSMYPSQTTPGGDPNALLQLQQLQQLEQENLRLLQQQQQQQQPQGSYAIDRSYLHAPSDHPPPLQLQSPFSNMPQSQVSVLSREERLQQAELRALDFQITKLRRSTELSALTRELQAKEEETSNAQRHERWLQEQSRQLQRLKMQQVLLKEEQQVRLQQQQWLEEMHRAAGGGEGGGEGVRKEVLQERVGVGLQRVALQTVEGISVLCDGLFLRLSPSSSFVSAPASSSASASSLLRTVWAEAGAAGGGVKVRCVLGIYDREGRMRVKAAASAWTQLLQGADDAVQALDPVVLRSVAISANMSEAQSTSAHLSDGLRAVAEVQYLSSDGMREEVRALGWIVVPLTIQHLLTAPPVVNSGAFRLRLRQGIPDPALPLAPPALSLDAPDEDVAGEEVQLLLRCVTKREVSRACAWQLSSDPDMSIQDVLLLYTPSLTSSSAPTNINNGNSHEMSNSQSTQSLLSSASSSTSSSTPFLLPRTSSTPTSSASSRLRALNNNTNTNALNNNLSSSASSLLPPLLESTSEAEDEAVPRSSSSRRSAHSSSSSHSAVRNNNGIPGANDVQASVRANDRVEEAKAVDARVWVPSSSSAEALGALTSDRDGFEAGDGVDVYVDGCRGLPDNVLVSRVSLRVFVRDKQQVGGVVEEVCRSNGVSASAPEFSLKAEVRGGGAGGGGVGGGARGGVRLDCTATALVRVDCLDVVTLQPCAVGYACLALFSDTNQSAPQQQQNVRSVRSQPRSPDVSPVWVSRGAFQLRLFAGRLSPQLSYFSEDMLSMSGLRIIPCASVLVRVYKAPRGKDGVSVLKRELVPQAQWRQLQLQIDAPLYSSGAYYSAECRPSAEEVRAFQTKLANEAVQRGSVEEVLRSRVETLVAANAPPPFSTPLPPLSASEEVRQRWWRTALFPAFDQVRRSLDLSLAVSLQDEISVWISGLRQLSATQLFPQQLQLQQQQLAQQLKSPLLSALRTSSAAPLRVTPFNNEVLCVPALLLSTSSAASSVASAEVLVGPQDLQVQSALRHPRYLRSSSSTSGSPSSSAALLRLKTASSGSSADLSLCLVIRLRFVQISAASKSAAPYLALPLGGGAGGAQRGAQGGASAKTAGDSSVSSVEICRWTLLPLVRSLLGDNSSSSSSSSDTSSLRYLQSGHIALPLFVGDGPDAALLSSNNPYNLLVQRLKSALEEEDVNTGRSRSRSTKNNKSTSSRSGAEKVQLDPEGASVCLQIAHPLLSDCVDLDAAANTTYMQSLLRAANASTDTLDRFIRPLSRPALPPSSASVSAVDAEVAAEGCSVAQMVPKCGALLQLTASASAQERETAVKEVLRGAQDALQMALRK